MSTTLIIYQNATDSVEIDIDDIIDIQPTYSDGLLGTGILIKPEVARERQLPACIFYNKTFVQTLLYLLTVQASIKEESPNKFFDAIKSDYRAIVEWIKNVIKK